MQPLRARHAAHLPVRRTPIMRGVPKVQEISPTLTIMEISDEEATRWDAYAETRKGFQVVG